MYTRVGYCIAIIQHATPICFYHVYIGICIWMMLKLLAITKFCSNIKICRYQQGGLSPSWITNTNLFFVIISYHKNDVKNEFSTWNVPLVMCHINSTWVEESINVKIQNCLWRSSFILRRKWNIVIKVLIGKTFLYLLKLVRKLLIHAMS